MCPQVSIALPVSPVGLCPFASTRRGAAIGDVLQTLTEKADIVLFDVKHIDPDSRKEGRRDKRSDHGTPGLHFVTGKEICFKTEVYSQFAARRSMDGMYMTETLYIFQ